MQAYFVRLRESRQVVGIYAAGSLSDLRELVDECVDPRECEALPVGPGGIYQPGPVPSQFPPRHTGEPDYETLPDDESPFTGASYTEVWSSVVREKQGWKPLG